MCCIQVQIPETSLLHCVMQLTFFYTIGSVIGGAIGGAVGSVIGSGTGGAIGGYECFYLFMPITAKLAEISLGHEELSMVMLAVELTLMCNTVGWGDYAASMGTSEASFVV